MEFDFSQAYDGNRLTNMTRASVQSNGHLNFPPDAARQMGLSLDAALLICPMGAKDLAVTVVTKDHARGFPLRKTGPYYYVPFRSLLNECGIDCSKVHVVYDIIELNESFEGKSVFKFNRRIINKAEESGRAKGVGSEGAAETWVGAPVGSEGTAEPVAENGEAREEAS